MGTTTSTSLRYPEGSQAPDVPGDLFRLASDVDDRLCRRDVGSAGTFIGQRALVNNIEYRWDGTAWAYFQYAAIDRSVWASFPNDGYADARGLTDLSVVGGVALLCFSTTRDAGIAVDQTMLRTAAGFRPAATVFFDGRTVDASGNRAPAGFRIEKDGTVYLDSTSGSNLRGWGGSAQFRIAA